MCTFYKSACAWQKDSVAVVFIVNTEIITCKRVTVFRLIKSQAKKHLSWLLAVSEGHISYA